MAAEGQALSDAAFRGDIVAIDRLLAGGASIDARDGDGFTALHRACVTGNAAVVGHLLSNGASVNAEDAYGDTGLHYSAFCGHKKVVELLLSRGADATARSKDGKTPLQSAAEEGHLETVDLFMRLAPPPADSEEFRSVQAARERRASGGGKAGGGGGGGDPGSPGVGTPGASGGAGRVAGLDFTHGVVVEGELHKKRKNRVVRWRRKHYVLSDWYKALFFWTGTRTTVEGVVKKVRYETFFSVKQHMDKHGGRRFDIKVVTGRTMELLAANLDEANMWVTTLKRTLGPFMGALRIQTAWRGYRARKKLKAIHKARDRAVGAAASAAAAGSRGRADTGDGVLMEGMLRKKVSKISASLLSAYRTRYFVLDANEKAMLYYDSKWQAKARSKPRKIPIVSLLSVDAPRAPDGSYTTRFHVRVATGRTWTFEAASPVEVRQWVEALSGVLPRDNIAAVRLQSAARGFLARRSYRKQKASSDAALARVAENLGRSKDELASAVRKTQNFARMVICRARFKAAQEKRRHAERRALEVRRHRLYLKSARKGSDADATNTATTPTGEGHQSRMARLRRLRELKKAKQEGGDPSSSPPPPPPSEWEEHVDEDSGRPFWFNRATGATTWIDPNARRIGDWVEVPQGDGKSYWLNEVTRETRWDEPPAPAPAPAKKEEDNNNDGGKPRPTWVAQLSEDNERYFANRDTGEVQWDMPAGFAEQFLDPPAGEGKARWYSEKDESTSLPYFVNAETGAAVWQRPADYDGPGAGRQPTDADWAQVRDPETGKNYWFCSLTGERSWKDPRSTAISKETSSSKSRRRSTMARRSSVRKRSTHISAEQLEAMNKANQRSAARGVGRRGGGDAGGVDSVVETGEAEDLPGGWTKEMDPATNRHYYFNSMTGESQWEKPGVSPGAEGVEEYDLSEVLAFQSWINDVLAAEGAEGGDLVGVLPLDLEASPPPLFEAVRNGVLLAKLVNVVQPGTLDERVLDKTASAQGEGGGMDGVMAEEEAHFFAHVNENPALANCQLALSASQSIGAFVGADVSAADVENGRPAPVLDLVWALWKRSLMDAVSVRRSPGIVRLANTTKNERVADLLQLAPEVILLRWINFHLAKVDPAAWDGEPLQARAIGSDLADGSKLAALLRILAPEHAEYLPETKEQSDAMETDDRVGNVLWVSGQIGVPAWFNVPAITSANVRLQLAFLASLFAVRPNLEASDAADDRAGAARGRGGAAAMARSRDIAELQAELDDMMKAEDDSGQLGREGTMLKAWINSLDIHGVFVRDLVQDLRDGTVLLKVLDRVEPGLVKWSRVDLAPRNRYRRVENCNLVIQLGKRLDFHLVNVAGLDIVDGSAKMVAGVTSQLMRHHLYKTLSNLAFEGFAVSSDKILEWANDKVQTSTDDPSCRVGSFNESSLGTGVYLAHVINQVSPVVDWSMVTTGDNEDECLANAKLLISLARKIGAAVYVAPEDLAEVKGKSIEMFLASLIVAERKLIAGREGDIGIFGGAIDEEDEIPEDDEDLVALEEPQVLGVEDGVHSSDDEDEE